MFIQPVVYQPKGKKEALYLLNELLKLGYEISSSNKEYEYRNYLATSIYSQNKKIGFLYNIGIVERVEVDNPDLFLAIAAMTDTPYGIEGEWWYCHDSGDTPLFTDNKLYRAIKSLDNGFCFINNNGKKDSYDKDFNLNRFRKATVDELINHFSNEKDMKNNQTLTRKQLVKLYGQFNCILWQKEISNLLNKCVFEEDDFLMTISDNLIEKLYKDGTADQIKAVEEFGIRQNKQKIFTTEDGFDIYEGDSYFWVKRTSNEFIIYQSTISSKTLINTDRYVNFFSKEKAESWLLRNRNLLSIEDIRNVLELVEWDGRFKELNRFVEEKVDIIIYLNS